MRPPSQAPFTAANTLAPVVARLIPKSRSALKGLLSSSLSATLKYSPLISGLALKISAIPAFFKSLLAKRRPVA